jgi:WD40 repeat protein
LKSGSQIGEDWKKEEGEKKVVMNNIALSPSGKTVVIGSDDRKMRFWDVKMGKVVATWTGHTSYVVSVCWSANGKHIMSGSWDGMVRVWNVKTGERILAINTGHEYLWAVLYSPDNTQIATGGSNEHAAKIWEVKTGKLLTTLKHHSGVCSLAWTSDGQKLISASLCQIGIFNTATWNQIATLEGHQDWVFAITLSHNNRLLASTSFDHTARVWNLDTNLPVEPPLQHKDRVNSAAFSANGRVLVTASRDKNAYTWDIHAILKQAGLEYLLNAGTNIVDAGTNIVNTRTNIVSANTLPTLGH